MFLIFYTFVMYPAMLCKLVIDIRVTTFKKKVLPYKAKRTDKSER